MAGSDHCFCTCCPSVRPHFSKQNKFQAKTMFATSETVGLAEWVIDNTWFVFYISYTQLQALVWYFILRIMKWKNNVFRDFQILHTRHSALKNSDGRTISFKTLFWPWWSLAHVIIVLIRHCSIFWQEQQQKISDENVLLLTHCEHLPFCSFLVANKKGWNGHIFRDTHPLGTSYYLVRPSNFSQEDKQTPCQWYRQIEYNTPVQYEKISSETRLK